MTNERQFTIIDNPDPDKWRIFVRSHPNGNIFQSYELFSLYRQVSSYEPGVLCLFDPAGTIRGILAYNIIREPGWKGYFSARSIISGGPLVSDNDSLLIQILVEEYLIRIHRRPVIYTQVRNLWQYAQLNEVLLKARFKYTDHLTYIIDLTQKEEQLQARLDRMRLLNIRRASKKNVEIEEATEADLPAINDLIRKTYNRINIPGPPTELLLSLSKCLPENCAAFIIRTNDIVIGCRVYLLYKSVMYDWYAGSDLGYSGLHPNDLLPWRAFLWGKKKGFAQYDFGGAGNPRVPYGVREYKKRFGGDPVNTGRYLLVHKHLFYRIGKIAMRIYKLIQ